MKHLHTAAFVVFALFLPNASATATTMLRCPNSTGYMANDAGLKISVGQAELSTDGWHMTLSGRFVFLSKQGNLATCQYEQPWATLKQPKVPYPVDLTRVISPECHLAAGPGAEIKDEKDWAGGDYKACEQRSGVPGDDCALVCP